MVDYLLLAAHGFVCQLRSKKNSFGGALIKKMSLFSPDICFLRLDLDLFNILAAAPPSEVMACQDTFTLMVITYKLG